MAEKKGQQQVGFSVPALVASIPIYIIKADI